MAVAEEENPELIDMTRRFRVSLILTVPLAILAMSRLFTDVLRTNSSSRQPPLS
jgi:hypothetical protein